MSAFMVGKNHIDAMVTVLLHGPARKPTDTWLWDPLPGIDPDALGRAFWGENLASVLYRYPDCTPDDLPGPIGLTAGDIEGYRYRKSRTRPTRAQAYNLLRCYEYQSCEHPDWRASAAHEWVQRLKDRLLAIDPEVRADSTWEWEKD